MDKPLFGRYRRLTHAEILILLVSILLVWTAYLTADIQYNRQLNYANQQNIANQAANANNQTQALAEQTASLHELLNRQGNISNSQRQSLLNQFVNISQHGGFATQEDIDQNAQILSDMNTSFASVNLKLDKLLNQSSVR